MRFPSSLPGSGLPANIQLDIDGDRETERIYSLFSLYMSKLEKMQGKAWVRSRLPPARRPWGRPARGRWHRALPQRRLREYAGLVVPCSAWWRFPEPVSLGTEGRPFTATR